MNDPPVYLAGIGVSPWSWPRSWLPALKGLKDINRLAISASTKALLDAGLSYDDVDQSIGCGDLNGQREAFYALGQTGVPIHSGDNDSCLYMAQQSIKTGRADCVLVIACDKYAAVGIIMISDAFLWAHPYLKDTSAIIRGYALGSSVRGTPTLVFVAEKAFLEADLGPSDIQIVESNARPELDHLNLARNLKTWSSSTALLGLCELIWLLRGWTRYDSTVQNCLQCTVSPMGTATVSIISRADGSTAPAFADVENKNDGRDRLGYNPSITTREISMEDWEAVRSRDEYLDKQAANNLAFRRKGGDRAALAKL